MVKKSKNPKKNNFFFKITLKKIKILRRRKKNCRKQFYPLSFPILGGRDSTRAFQSSPFQISCQFLIGRGGRET